jgi:hypothetical protein
MLLPKISEATVENVTNEFFRGESIVYLAGKIKQLNEHDPVLMTAVNDLCNQVFVGHDDADEGTKSLNKMRAVAICLIVLNVVNTQMEINWLES